MFSISIQNTFTIMLFYYSIICKYVIVRPMAIDAAVFLLNKKKNKDLKLSTYLKNV